MFPDIPQYGHPLCVRVRTCDSPPFAVPISTTIFSARVQSNSRPTRSSSAASLIPYVFPCAPTSSLWHLSSYSPQKLISRSTPAQPTQMGLLQLRDRQPRRAPPPQLHPIYDPRIRWFPASGLKVDCLLLTSRPRPNRTQAAGQCGKTQPKSAKRACVSARRG